jgi:pSer/pThr/pTyr-binding forkhead associated (FHA) protein
MFIEFIEGPESGRRVQLDRVVELGREVPGGVSTSDPQMSRRHARFVPGNDGVVVEDLGSSNGTFVNGERIFAPTVLRPGDQVLMGLSVAQLQGEDRRDISAVRPVPPPLAIPPRAPDYITPVSPAAPERQDIDGLLDVRTKAMARLAPLAIVLVVVLAAIAYLATRS